MSELKTCPFCGHFAIPMVDEIYSDIDEEGKPKWATRYLVVCTKCMSQSGYYADPVKSREAWNRRAQEK